MVNRPYFEKTAAELRTIAADNWCHYDQLEVVKAELGFRSTQRAANLKRVVEQRLSELKTGQPQAKNGLGRQSLDQLQAYVVALERKVRAAQIAAESAERRAQEAHSTSERLGFLEQQLSRAEGALRAAEYRAKKAETQLAQFCNATDAYAVVGLIPSCPDFVFDTVRRAFLKKHHPDSLGPASEAAKSKAAEQFKWFHSVFERLAASRT